MTEHYLRLCRVDTTPAPTSVVVASTAHCAAHPAQYPKDHAQDEQDAADCPKDADVEQRSEDKQDNAKNNQRVPPVVGFFVSFRYPASRG